MKNLRKILFIVFIISFGVFLSNIQLVCARGESEKTLHFVDASSNNFPPMNALDKDGGLTGFGRELADAVIKEVGGEVEHIHSSQWGEVLEWLDTGKADFIHDTGYTKDRDIYLDYSDPIIEMPEAIFVRPDEYSITNLDSLKGKKVACVNKHITHLYLQQFPEISLFVVKTPAEGIYELISGKVDAFVYPKQIVLYLVQNLRLRDKVKITGEPLRILTWSMVVKEGNNEILRILNEGISRVRKSGEYDHIYNKWWGEKVLAGYSKKELLIITLGVTGASLAVLIAIVLLLFNRNLRQNKKTLENEIAERKLAEEKLFFTKAAVDHSSDSAFWSKQDGSFFYVNDQACKSLGYSREELMKMRVSDFDPNFPPEAWVDHWQDLKKRGSIKVETTHKNKDGKIFPVEIMATFMEYEGEEYNCSFVRDITERKQAEEEKANLNGLLPKPFFKNTFAVGAESSFA